MSETPFFDSTSADNEEVAITVHDETVELRNWNGHGDVVRTVVADRLEFNFNEPYTHPSMPGTSYRPHIQDKPEGIVFPTSAPRVYGIPA